MDSQTIILEKINTNTALDKYGPHRKQIREFYPILFLDCVFSLVRKKIKVSTIWQARTPATTQKN